MFNFVAQCTIIVCISSFARPCSAEMSSKSGWSIALKRGFLKWRKIFGFILHYGWHPLAQIVEFRLTLYMFKYLQDRLTLFSNTNKIYGLPVLRGGLSCSGISFFAWQRLCFMGSKRIWYHIDFDWLWTIYFIYPIDPTRYLLAYA